MLAAFLGFGGFTVCLPLQLLLHLVLLVFGIVTFFFEPLFEQLEFLVLVSHLFFFTLFFGLGLMGAVLFCLGLGIVVLGLGTGTGLGLVLFLLGLGTVVSGSGIVLFLLGLGTFVSGLGTMGVVLF